MEAGRVASPLRIFIHGVGLIIFAASLSLIPALLAKGLQAGVRLDFWFVGMAVAGLFGVIARVGWRMFRDWNDATVAGYVHLQAIFAAVAIAKLTNFNLPTILLVYLVTVNLLTPYLRRHFKFPRPHTRAWVEMKTAPVAPEPY